MRHFKNHVFFAVAGSGLALGVIMPILTPLTRELGLADSQGGAIVSIGSAVMALTAAAWGRFSDRYGRRAGFLAGFIGLFIGYVLFTLTVWQGLRGALTGTALFGALVLARAFIGAQLPAIPATAQALIADHTTPEDRPSAMALIGMANGVGMVVGPAIGGALAVAGLIYPLLVTIALMLIGSCVIWATMSAEPAKGLNHTQDRIDPRQADLWPWLAIGFFTFFAILTMQVCAGYYLQDSLSLAGSDAALTLAIALTTCGVCLILSQALQMLVLKWDALRLGMIGPLFMIAGLALLLLTQTPVSYYAAYGLMGMGAGLLMTAVSAGTSLAVGEEQQGAAGGLMAAVQASAAIAAPYLSTLLYQVRPAVPFLLIGGFLVLALLLSAGPARRKPIAP